MEPAVTTILERQIQAGEASYRITLREEDLSRAYPVMTRYTMELFRGEQILGLARTNSYEYSPCTPLHAREVANKTVAQWEAHLKRDPDTFLASLPAIPMTRKRVPGRSVVIIQGSPRPGGNCAILASWAADAAREAGVKTTVLFPHDLDIHLCIGCYQCYNTGTCIFQDDMTDIIDAVAQSLLVVICSPVYTNTVPAGLKALIDRFQAMHAERTLGGDVRPERGLLMVVAGRKGTENFRCVSAVAKAFFSLLEITPALPIFVDGMDVIRDLRTVPGLKELIRSRMKECLGVD